MAVKSTELDVLVLGEDPSGYLAAALLGAGGHLRIAHGGQVASASEDRLVLINPALFSLHELLAPLRRKLSMAGIYGVRFLDDDPSRHSEHHGKSAMAHVASLADVRAAFCSLAQRQGVELHRARTIKIAPPDADGVSVTLGRSTVRARALIVSDRPDAQIGRTLRLPDRWPAELLHRYSYVLLDRPDWLDKPSHPVMPMSLDVHGQLAWAWMLQHGERVQLAVLQSAQQTSAIAPTQMLRWWAQVLVKQDVMPQILSFADRQVRSIDLPLAGALEQEAVGDRTLLIGPAGGFCSASAEEIYPACWSAQFASEVLKRALRAEHLQDALQGFRHKWRTTLGDYLRGPQQSLRFLLPLVYRNQVMTTRLIESILSGKSMVR